MEVIEDTPLFRADGVLYPAECEHMVTRAKPEHITQFKELLRVLDAVAWPALAKGLLSDDAEEVVGLMETYRLDYLEHEEADSRIEYDFVKRVVLAETLRELEWKKEVSLYLLRLKLVGEARVRARDLEIDQATLDFENLVIDEEADPPPYVIWE